MQSSPASRDRGTIPSTASMRTVESGPSLTVAIVAPYFA
jgi:hypothetical protein